MSRKCPEIHQFSTIMVKLTIVLEHTDHIETFTTHSLDERFIGKPCIHEQIVGKNTCSQSFADHCDSSIRFLHDRICPIPVTNSTFVYGFIDAGQTLALFCGYRIFKELADLEFPDSTNKVYINFIRGVYVIRVLM